MVSWYNGFIHASVSEVKLFKVARQRERTLEGSGSVKSFVMSFEGGDVTCRAESL